MDQLAFLRRFLPVFAFLGFFGQGTAHAACVEPPKPTCVARLSIFSDKPSMERCQKEIESFVSKVEPWLNCKRYEKEEHALRAREQWNCIALREGPCL